MTDEAVTSQDQLQTIQMAPHARTRWSTVVQGGEIQKNQERGNKEWISSTGETGSHLGRRQSARGQPAE